MGFFVNPLSIFWLNFAKIAIFAIRFESLAVVLKADAYIEAAEQRVDFNASVAAQYQKRRVQRYRQYGQQAQVLVMEGEQQDEQNCYVEEYSDAGADECSGLKCKANEARSPVWPY